MIEHKVVFAVVLKKSLKRRTDSGTKYDIMTIQLDHNESDEHVSWVNSVTPYLRQFFPQPISF